MLVMVNELGIEEEQIKTIHIVNEQLSKTDENKRMILALITWLWQEIWLQTSSHEVTP